MKGFSTKSIKAQLSDIDENSRIIKGYLSVFGNKDSEGEVVISGAFTKTIAERGPGGSNRIRHFMDHNITKGIGSFKELIEDDQGLMFVSQLGRHTLGMDAFFMYQDGIITEHSIGYDIIRDDYTTDGTRELLELRLWEGSSLQGWGANPLALVADVKMEQINAIEKILSKSKMSDETIQDILLQLKVIKQTLTPREAPEPLEDYSEYYKTLNLKI